MKNNQTKNDINAAELFWRKVVLIFLALVSIISIGFAVLYSVSDTVILQYFMYLLGIQHSVWLLALLYNKDMLSNASISVYITYIIVLLYPITCIFWNAGYAVVFTWYLLIIIGALVFDISKIEQYILLTVIAVFAVFFCNSLFSQENITPSLIYRVNMMTVISTIILGSFFAIVYVKKLKIDESMHTEMLQAIAENTENSEKDKALYNDMIEYLEKDKPFKNPDFNAQMLAKELPCHVNDIAKIIRAGGGGNFNMLLNGFRISYVKSMLDSGAMKKYTIDYIYSEAGYKYRSTFNTAFKSIMGMTPSDYVSQQNTNDNSKL